MTTIGNRIRKARIAKAMTLEEVAKYVQVSRQTIQRYESGVIGNIPSDKIELLSNALNVSPGYIMGWEDKGPLDVQELTLHAAAVRALAKLSKTDGNERKNKILEIVCDILQGNHTLDQLNAISAIVKTMK